MDRQVLGIKNARDGLVRWHITPNNTWRTAWFYGSGPKYAPCGVTGYYEGRLDFGVWDRAGDRYGRVLCIDCLELERTGEWPADPVMDEKWVLTWPSF